MNILFVTSAAPLQSPFFTNEKRPPLGIGFLISILRNAGHEVFFIDNYLLPTNFLETDFLQKNAIDFVGIYSNTICFRDTLRMIHRLNYLRLSGQWKGKIIVGGPHTTTSINTIPLCVDYIVQGEGEHAILDIVNGAVKERVLCYPRIKNLDELPMPAWDYFINQPYNWETDFINDKPVFTMNTSRGCTSQCAFCSVGSIWGRKYTYFSAERIVADIQYLMKKHGAKGIYFREDNFTINRKRLVKFCNLLIDNGVQIPWACESRVDTLDRDLIKLMYQAGLRGFYFGVESGSQRILDLLKKGITVEQIRRVFEICHEFDINTAASIVVNIPTESDEDIRQTRKLLKEIKPTITWYNIFVGIPNSELYQYSINNRLYDFIDDRGLVYLKGHNDYVRQFYGNQLKAYIPVNLEKPDISVIMSAYNSSPNINEAVQSILGQTFQNIEFIIVNDCSTDNTQDILRSYQDPRLIIIENPVKLGLAKSLNKALNIAKGKYVARMDSDDISLPHRLETEFKFLKNHPDHALVGSSFYQINKTGKIEKTSIFLSNHGKTLNVLESGSQFCHGSVMFVRDIIINFDGYDENLKYAQDYDLWFRISEKYKISNIAEPLYCWRVFENSNSVKNSIEKNIYADKAKEKLKLSHFNIIAKSASKKNL